VFGSCHFLDKIVFILEFIFCVQWNFFDFLRGGNDSWVSILFFQKYKRAYLKGYFSVLLGKPLCSKLLFVSIKKGWILTHHHQRNRQSQIHLDHDRDRGLGHDHDLLA